MFVDSRSLSQRTNSRTREENWPLEYNITFSRCNCCWKNIFDSNRTRQWSPRIEQESWDGSEKESVLLICEPVHFGLKLGSKSLLGISGYITFGIFLGIFGHTSFGRWLLLKYPSVFTL